MARDRIASATLMLLALTLAPAAPAAARDLTFEDRVKAQESIERVYYSHQIGAKRSFEEAVPRSVLEQKVRTYLKESVALEEFWHTPVTAEALRRETERMARQTRIPERLRDLYAALGNDPFLVQECLARPVLVNRLTRSSFASDSHIHAAAREEAERLRKRLLNGDLDVAADDPHRMILEVSRASEDERARTRANVGLSVAPRAGSESPWRIGLGAEEFARVRAQLPERIGAVGPVVDERDAFVVRVLLDENSDRVRVAGYSVAKATWDAWWEEVAGALDERRVPTVAASLNELPAPIRRPAREWGLGSSTGRPVAADQVSPNSTCTLDDAWDNGSLGVPERRGGHTAVWTGSVMVVWGGIDFPYWFNTGGRYDPVTDRWTATSTTNAPTARRDHTAVWTGSIMVVWGGDESDGTSVNTGGRYDPVTDTWAPTSTINAPLGRYGHTAVWTGGVMVVWGGQTDLSGPGPLNTGGRYDPATDTWMATTTIDAPTARSGHTAVWTGRVMVVWGGFICPYDCSYLDTGGRYDPVTDTWTATSLVNSPSKRTSHTAVWTGSVVVVWGGDDGISFFSTGGRYDPATDVWAPTATKNAPSGTSSTAVWTGGLMLVWGGSDGGGRYDSVADTWTPISVRNAPAPRVGHTAIWTGSLMVVWGGNVGYASSVDAGGRYDPITDTWTPTAPTDVPTPRNLHTMVWTGNVMVVWGGGASERTSTGGENPNVVNTGGRYDPVIDSWSPVSTTNAPAARRSHTAVWTGSLMVVWGGNNGVVDFDSGGRYDPISDRWASTATRNAPGARSFHTAVWTGTLMLVWGGIEGSTNPSTGGRYDPLTNTWAPTSPTGAPGGRALHTAVWTGREMVVWGGESVSSPFFLNTGGRYDPGTDSWSPTSIVNAPTERSSHTAVWTGSEMMVWGGNDSITFLNTGGRYDPNRDAWALSSTVNAPSGRRDHTAVWTGGWMVVWGGYDGSLSLATGGRYDPVIDTWTPTSTSEAAWRRSQHTAIWTGSSMIVWGGAFGYYLNTGGQYIPGVDADHDSFTACGGDCDDSNPAIHPGAVEVCNGVDDNCINGIDEGGDALCTDANTCTNDTCGGTLGCLHLAVIDGTPCDDGSACTTVDTCQAGICRGSVLRDADADGHADSLCGGDDCNDSNPMVWFPPVEVTNLNVATAGPADLGWDSQGILVGPETLYDVVSGVLSIAGGLDFSSAVCLQSGAATTYSDSRPDAPVGSGFWYLVRGQNSCGVGTYGTSQQDTSIPPCP